MPFSVFNLVALRGCLTSISLNDNPLITDDAIPALALFSHLTLLHLSATSVTMVGLRHLAVSFAPFVEERAFDLAVPDECEDYLNSRSPRDYKFS